MLIYAIIVTFVFGALCGSVATVLIALKMTKDDAQNLDVPSFMKPEIPSQPTILV
jgi:hypothetical protein